MIYLFIYREVVQKVHTKKIWKNTI